MRYGLRTGGIAAPLLALAASTASATPPIAAHSLAQPAASVVSNNSEIASDASTSPTSPEAPTPPLYKLVRAHGSSDEPSPEQKCLAEAVYFEARGEPLEGQLAVAEVVLNRAESGHYPASICKVVTQPEQFSFVRNGLIPEVDESSLSWRRALAIAAIAKDKLANELEPDVLWYHADYVAPKWDRGLAVATQIGAHIFYRRA